ncbi:hypothetical protein GWI33_005430 [Rhynchophorus ferrugineus]|uniref:Uncharacterized protein n=1 Tax=Rhynchophorus ferrugineus TaxID=354439 RepID=A0A834IK39_RHYFE|nr:hypothetical protein GWI33_005430 [Rhynchophorus ferrugineus]
MTRARSLGLRGDPQPPFLKPVIVTTNASDTARRADDPPTTRNRVTVDDEQRRPPDPPDLSPSYEKATRSSIAGL